MNYSDITAAVVAEHLSPELGRLLARMPPAQWAHLVLALDPEGNDRHGRVLSRGELAAELRAADLPALAREAERRRVPAGALLVFAIGSEGPRFRVLFGDTHARSKRPHGPTSTGSNHD